MEGGCLELPDYQFAIAYGDFVDEKYSLVYSYFLKSSRLVVNSVPTEINKSFSFKVERCKFSFPFIV